MLGDTAVAVNPEDERYRAVIGKKVILPVIHREFRLLLIIMWISNSVRASEDHACP